MYSTQNIIIWAKASQFLAEKEMSFNRLMGIDGDQGPPVMLYTERKSLEWMYTANSSDPDLYDVGNYVYALCGKYLAEAKMIVALSGGNIVNPTTSETVGIEAILKQFTIGDAGSPIAAGATTYTLPYKNIIANSISVELPQSNLPTGQTNQFSYNVSYSANSAVISFLNDDGSGNNLGVQTGMLFIIRGLRLVASSVVGGTGGQTGEARIKIVNGADITSNIYNDPDYNGYNLILQLNGSRTLLPGEYTDTVSGGGFELLLGVTLGTDDNIVVIPNGLR